MTASAATTGYGLILKKGATAIAETRNVDGPGIDRDMIEVTNLTSPAAYKEFIGGMLDGGEVSCDLNWLPTNATHKAIITDLTAVPQVTNTYSVVLTDSGATTIGCTLLPKSFKIKAATKEGLLASVTFKVTGPVTGTAAGFPT